ncbi:MAG: cell division protein SepF [Hominenteromicrobium sp.]|uniref:cell division protein SepF n=1 Tax=Hominenteromicrobium sp. TaxID=3073581 RepID=UPI0039A2333F
MAGIVEKLQKMWNPPDDEYDEYYEDEATEPTADSREEQPSARRSFSSSSSNRVVNINHARAGAQVVVFKPNSFRDDTNSIADEINQGHTVVVNFEETNAGEARYILAFLSGASLREPRRGETHRREDVYFHACGRESERCGNSR